MLVGETAFIPKSHANIFKSDESIIIIGNSEILQNPFVECNHVAYVSTTRIWQQIACDVKNQINIAFPKQNHLLFEL